MRTTRTFRHTAVSVSVAALALTTFAACGGDDDDGGGEPLTEAEFKEQADAICAENNDDMNAAGEEAFGDSTEMPEEEALKSFVEDDIVPKVEEQIDELDDIVPPEDLQEDWDALLEQAQTDLEEMKSIDNYTEYFNSGEEPFEETNALATDLGLEDCSQ
jgi:hypothetical protein